MNSYSADKRLFYKLIRKQRGQNSGELATIDFGTGVSQLDGWATYYEELATPSNNPEYDEQYKQTRELLCLMLKHQESKKQQVP